MSEQNVQSGGDNRGTDQTKAAPVDTPDIPDTTQTPDTPRPVADLSCSQFNLLAREVARGYPMKPKDKEDAVACCMQAIRNGKKTARTRLAAVRALAVLSGQNLRDIHHLERLQADAGFLDLQKLKIQRAEEGKPNDSLLVQVVPVEKLPDPDWFARKREKLLEPSES